MYNRSEKSDSIVLFADPPNLEDLCLVSVSVDKILQTVPSTSRFQIQTIKCREIIFTEPDVIATPLFEYESIFHVVMQKSLFKTGRLQSRFQKLGLEISKPSAVSTSQYQSCLRYTLLAKMAPSWNKAGPWLIQGRDFLMQAGYVNAVKMDVSVTSGELFFTIEASTVRFPSLKLEDLDIPTPCYKNFLRNQTAVVYQHSIPMVWCHILPSMKKGKIVSISHELPDDCPFKSYKDIKRHWKNHYGYRLPEYEDDMLYYQINFRPIGEKLFTYPEICMRARDIQKVPRVDPKPILLAFLQDLQKKMSKICGFPLKLHSKACYPSMDLAESTKVDKSSAQQNLTSKPPNKNFSYRKPEEIQKLVTEFRNDVSRPEHNLTPQKNSLSQNQSNLDRNINQKNQIVQSQSTSNSVPVRCNAASQYSEQLVKSVVGQDVSIACINQSILQTTQENRASRIIPSFKSKGKVLNLNSQTSQLGESFKRVVPVFKPISSRTNLTPSQSTSSKSNLTPSKPNVPNAINNVESGSEQRNNSSISVPVFSNRKNINALTKGNVKQTAKKSSSLNIPLQQQRVGIRHTASPSLSAPNITTPNRIPLQSNRSETMPITPLPGKILKTPQLAGTVLKTPQHSGTILKTPQLSGTILKTPQFSGKILKTPKSGVTPRSGVNVHVKSCGTVPLTPKINTTNFSSIPSTPCTPAMKRPCPSSNESTPAMKKPRPKQQIQDVNVEILARSFQLHKVNTVTLVSWLKEKGVVCKAKDKIGDLVEKAMKLLNLTVSEQ